MVLLLKFDLSRVQKTLGVCFPSLALPAHRVISRHLFAAGEIILKSIPAGVSAPRPYWRFQRPPFGRDLGFSLTEHKLEATPEVTSASGRTV